MIPDRRDYRRIRLQYPVSLSIMCALEADEQSLQIDTASWIQDSNPNQVYRIENVHILRVEGAGIYRDQPTV